MVIDAKTLALRRCRKCGRQFVSRGKKCPYCGNPIERRLLRLRNILAIVLALNLLNYVFTRFKDKPKEKSVQLGIEARQTHNKPPEFVQNIDHHYQGLLSNFDAKMYKQVINELHLFKKNNQTHYKNVAQIKKKTIACLDEIVRKIPMAKTIENLRRYRQLLSLDPENSRYKKKVAFYEKKKQPQIS